MAAALAAAIGIGLGATPRADAADGTWTGSGTDGLWENASNWTSVPGSTAGAAGTSTDVASFSGMPVVANQVVTVDANRNVFGLFFDPDPSLSDGDPLTVSPVPYIKIGAAPNAGNPLYLSGGGTTQTSSVNLTGGDPVESDINAPMVLNGTSYTFTNNAGDTSNTFGALRLFGNITPSLSGLTTITLDGDHGSSGSSRAEVLGAVTDGPGQVSIVKNGIGCWEVNADSSNPNTYSGDTIINGGILRSSTGSGTNGLGGFSPNSHYIVNNGGTLRNSVVGSTIGKLTIKFGGIVNVSTNSSTRLNVKTDSGPAINLDFTANTHSNAIPVNAPFGLTGTTPLEGGLRLLATPGPTGTGPVTVVGTSSGIAGFFDMGTVKRVLDIGKGADGNTDYDLRIQGTVSGADGFIKTGPGKLRFSGPNLSPLTGTIEIQEGTFNPSIANIFTASPSLLVSGGTLHLQSGQAQTFGPVTMTKGQMTGGDNNVSVAAPSFTFNVAGADTARADVILANAGGGPTSVTKNGAGTVNVEIAPTYTGTTTVNGGTLAFAANFTSSAALNVTGGTLELSASDTAPNRVMKVDSVSITGDGRIDLTRNKLITETPVGTFSGDPGVGTYDGVQGLVQRAYNFGGWDQPGLMTSEENAGPNAGPLSNTTTIGVATAERVLFVGPTETALFVGQTVTGATTIAMYTYAGDMNFDGLIDVADYGSIDNWIQFPGTNGYMNGDLNYDGVIDVADYGVIDNSIQLQGAPFPGVTFASADGSSAGLSGVTAVPEPSACGLALAAAAAGLLRRRHRRRGPRAWDRQQT